MINMLKYIAVGMAVGLLVGVGMFPTLWLMPNVGLWLNVPATLLAALFVDMSHGIPNFWILPVCWMILGGMAGLFRYTWVTW